MNEKNIVARASMGATSKFSMIMSDSADRASTAKWQHSKKGKTLSKTIETPQ
jgi:hypothetical protein